MHITTLQILQYRDYIHDQRVSIKMITMPRMHDPIVRVKQYHNTKTKLFNCKCNTVSQRGTTLSTVDITRSNWKDYIIQPLMSHDLTL